MIFKKRGFVQFLKTAKMQGKEFSIDDEVINLEWAAKNDKKPPKGRKYQFMVDNDLLTSDTETMTGEEILRAAGKVPTSNFILRQKTKGQWKTVKPSDTVDFTEPGVEKFKQCPNSARGNHDGMADAHEFVET